MTILLTLLLLAFAQQTESTIEGVVVRDGTNQPLVNVQVALWPTSTEVTTKDGGAYAFRDVPPGQYMVVVVHDGMRLKMPVTMNFRQRMNVTLRVPSAPAVSGTVFDPNGERLAGARVQALRLVYTRSGQRMRSVAETLTDDRGEYRMFWLRPGEYTISASYSEREQLSAADGLLLSPNLSKPDNGYPAVYSQSVDLRTGGEANNVNLLLKEGSYVTISGRLVDPQGMGVCGRIALVSAGGAVSGDKDFGPRVCNSFVLGGASPGAYSMLALAEGLASDVIPLSVSNQGLRDIVVQLKKAVDVGGRVTLDGSTPQQQTATRVMLARDSPNIDQRIPAEMYPDGSFTLKNIGPGAFFVVVESFPENTYVKSIRVGNATIAAGGGRAGAQFRSLAGAGREVLTAIRFDPQFPEELGIQLSSTGGTSEGAVVDRAGQPVPGAEVVLLPASASPFFGAREDQLRVGTADGVGRFRVSGVPPGNYRVYAFEELGPDAHYALAYNTTLANEYFSMGQPVTVLEGQRVETRLIAIPVSETTGALR